MLEGTCGYDHKTYRVSDTCEVLLSINETGGALCGQPTTHFYPTQRGTQSLCAEHAQRHLPHSAWPAASVEDREP